MKQILLIVLEAIFSIIVVRLIVLFAFAVRFQLDIMTHFASPITFGRVVYYLLVFGGAGLVAVLNQKIFKSVNKILAWAFPILLLIWGLI